MARSQELIAGDRPEITVSRAIVVLDRKGFNRLASTGHADELPTEGEKPKHKAGESDGADVPGSFHVATSCGWRR